MASAESWPQPQGNEQKGEGKKKEDSSALGRMGRRAAFAMAVGMGASLAPAAEGAEVPNAKPEISQRANQEGMNPQMAAKKLEEANNLLRTKIEKLGLFSGGPEFVETVKKNSEALQIFLKNPEQKLPSFSGPLGEIVGVYAKPLQDAKQYAPEKYQETVARFDKAIYVIQTTPINKVQAELKSVF